MVFAEAAAADFIEVAQIALNVLKGEDGFPTEAAHAVADGIRHLLVDEFQDTSRRQHQLLAHLIAAWPEREGRTCFVVGDPMQSIYCFREADAELFPRVEATRPRNSRRTSLASSIPSMLTANFRTEPPLVASINETFAQVFAADDGSGIVFAASQPARDDAIEPSGPHLVAASRRACSFMSHSCRNRPAESRDPDREKRKSPPSAKRRSKSKSRRSSTLIRDHLPQHRRGSRGKREEQR